MITVVGIPVYFHYCGGELEEVSYLLKSNSCCGEEEDSGSDNDCCKDEHQILKSDPDFTIKEQNVYAFVKSSTQLPFISLPFIPTTKVLPTDFISSPFELPPPELQHKSIISTSVLRI